jgi:hypothetical protein
MYVEFNALCAFKTPLGVFGMHLPWIRGSDIQLFHSQPKQSKTTQHNTIQNKTTQYKTK